MEEALIKFVICFSKLKEATNDSPKALFTFYRQNKTLREVCDDMYWAASRVRRTSREATVLKNVPDTFTENWKDFSSRWDSVISHCYWSGVFSGEKESVTFEALEARAKPDSSWDSYALMTSDELLVSVDNNFHPAEHSLGSMLNGFFGLSIFQDNPYKFKEYNGVDLDEVKWDVGLDALRFLIDVLEISPVEIGKRWDGFLPILVPVQIAKSHSNREKGGLFELLEDAIRSYLVGSVASSIAMCRSVLELLLSQHYLLPEEAFKSNGYTKNLGELISLASSKYEALEEKRLKHFSESSNEIVHRYSQRGKISDEDEQFVIEFFDLLRHYIEKAPR